METLTTFFLVLHATAGAGALLTGTAIGFLKKGDRRHRLLGQWFVRCMLTVGGTAFFLATVRPSPFLFVIGVYSVYVSLMGRTAFGERRTWHNVAPWILGLTSLALAVWSIVQDTSMMILGLVFGLGFLSQAVTDIINLRTAGNSRRVKLIRHISWMGGALISTWTAFLVVNIQVSWQIVLWIAPGVLGGLAISRAIRRYVGPSPANNPS